MVMVSTTACSACWSHENSNDWTHGSWKFRSDFRRLNIGSTVSTTQDIPFTDGRVVKTNMLATVSELHSDQIILSFSDISLTLFKDHFDAVRVADDV